MKNSTSIDTFILQLMNMEGWGITNTVDGEVRESGTIVAVLDALDRIENTNVSMYWTTPEAYLGNKVSNFYVRFNVSTCWTAPEAYLGNKVSNCHVRW